MAAVLPRAGAGAAGASARRPGSGLPLRRSALAAHGPFFSSEAAPTPAPAAAAGAEEDGDDLRGRIFRLGLAKRSATAALEKWSSEGRAAPAASRATSAAPAATSTPSRFGSQLNDPFRIPIALPARQDLVCSAVHSTALW